MEYINSVQSYFQTWHFKFVFQLQAIMITNSGLLQILVHLSMQEFLGETHVCSFRVLVELCLHNLNMSGAMARIDSRTQNSLVSMDRHLPFQQI